MHGPADGDQNAELSNAKKSEEFLGWIVTVTHGPAGLRKYVDAISHLFEHKSSRVDLLR